MTFNIPFIPQAHQLDPAIRSILDTLINWARILNGNLELGTGTDTELGAHVEGQFHVITTDATPGNETTITHNLERAVVGYSVIRRDKAGIIYDGTTAWTTTNIYVKCDVASMTCTLFLY